MEIIERVSLEDIRRAKPAYIFYAARTCWWTHDPMHLSTLPSSEEEIKRYAETFRLNSSTPDAPLDEYFERARKAARGLPCDPRGSVLFQTDNIEGFLMAAEDNADHYGKHGIRAFMAAHHSNCVISLTDLRPTSGREWQEYNDALDRLDACKIFKGESMKGLYISDDGRAEFDVPEFLRANGFPDTEKNRDMAIKVMEQVFREQGIIGKTTKVAHNHIHRCVRCQTDWRHDGLRTKCILPKYAQCVKCKN